MAKKIQMMSHDKEWQVVDGVETLVPVEQFDIDPITDSSCVKIEGFRTLEETLNEKNMFTPEVSTTKVMDKVGGEYHQNVVDGAYEEAILYGNTQVNLCEEDTSNTLTIPTTFTSFNNGELQINNKENQVVAPLIKGVTMVNLAQTNSASITSGNAMVIRNVKGNTVYTLSFTFTTKNTNSGVTIQCYDGNGTFIENTIHKTGLGDVVKFTFTTHANATKVHICNNAAYGGETIQLDEIMLIEGDQTALDIPFFRGMKSVELVRPLTNLFDNNTPTNHSWTGVTNVDGTVTATSQTSGTWTYARFNITFKPNTSYIVMWDSLSYTQTGNANQTIAICYGNDIIANIDNNFTNKRSIIFNTGDKNPSDINLRIHATTKNTETGTTTVTGLRVFEYDDYLRSVDLQSIGWFSGTKNVAVEPIKTCSKNLYPYGDVNFTSSSAAMWCDAKGNQYMYGDIAQKSKSRFLLRKGTYKFSYNSVSNAEAVALTDDKGSVMYYGDTAFTLTQDAYFSLVVKTINANTLTTVSNIQIERGTTATDYVAHDSRYYEPNGQNAVVLRSLPNGVCDTFNLQTGEYTRRIGEITVNGDGARDNIIDGAYARLIIPSDKTTNVYADVIGFYCSGAFTLKNKGASLNNYGIYENPANFVLFDKTVSSAEEFASKYSNVVIQYQLATPITTIIPRTIKRNNNGTVSTVDFKTYTNKENLRLPKNPSYLTINSMTSIKPVVEPITYIDFKTRLKTNTDYSVIIDKNSTDKTINLGGTSKTYTDKMLVRTPSINLEQNLRISGNGSIQNIIVCEGDVLDKELPYFNGMCNVKMPIVRNCGKNLFDINDDNSISLYMGSSNLIINNNKVQWNVTNWNQGIILRVKTYGNDKLRLNFKENTDLIGKTTSANGRPNFYDVRAFNRNKEELGKPTMNTGGHPSRLIENIPKNCDYIAIYAKTNAQQSGLEGFQDLTITNVDNGNICEPYRGNDICLVQGEIGLSQDMFESGGYGTGNGGTKYEDLKYVENSRTRIKTYLRVKPSTSYRLTYDGKTKFNHREYDINGAINGTFSTFDVNDKVFTTQSSTEYITMLIECSYSSFNVDYLQLLELDSTVQLRSLPNGAKDELNLLTGEYIQRVGEVVLDGSDDEPWDVFTGRGGLKYFRIPCPTMAENNREQETPKFLIADKFNFGKYNYLYESTSIPEDAIGGTTKSSALGVQCIYVYYKNINVIDTFKQYLQQNPITVQYQLAKPIISYPRIVSNTQEREVGIKLPNGVCDTYNPSTGIRVQRVGKVILDGSEKYARDGSSTKPTDLERFSTPIGDMVSTPYNTGNFVVETSGYNIVNNDKTSPRKLPNVWNYYQANIYLDFATTAFGMATSDSVDTKISKLKTYLASNPITIYYELKNPIVTTDIVLPNGVHDDYNPITGLYTKRVGCIEFDGSNDERWSPTLGTGNSTHCYASISIDGTISPEMKHMANNDEVYIMSNSYETVARSNYSYDKEQMYVWSVRTVYLNILQSKLSAIDMVGFRAYLSQNPIKLWYELQTPQKIQLTPYFGLPMPYAYKDGHLIMDSAYNGVSLPPEFKYKLVANRTGQVNQNNIKLQQHTARLSNLEAMLVEATLQSMYEREMMAFNLEMVNINLINLEE